jgi:hypothetical protein
MSAPLLSGSRVNCWLVETGRVKPSTHTLVVGVARKVRQNNRVLLGQLLEERELAASVSFIQVNSSGTSASANFLSISKR